MPLDAMLFLGCAVATFGAVGAVIYYAQRQTEAVQRAARLAQTSIDAPCIDPDRPDDKCPHDTCSEAACDRRSPTPATVA